MSLSAALNVGASGLYGAQSALQVTGNNIANVDNPNYSRETADLTSQPSQEIKQGVYIGTGVDLTSVQRQIDQALNSRLNSSISDNEGANVSENWSGQIQTAINALGTTNLQTQVSAFTSAWSSLANNPTDTSLRQTVIQAGQSLAQQFNSLDSQLSSIQTNIGQTLTTTATSAGQLASQIATLNGQIGASQTNLGADNSLQDQRDADVQSLSKLVNVQTVDQGNGTVNVYVGSEPLVVGTNSAGLKVQQTAQNGQPVFTLQFASNNETVVPTSGQLGALLNSQTQINTVRQQANSLAGGVAFGVNSIYSNGQGTSGYTSVTSTSPVLSTTAPLNSAAANLPFQPVNGSFVVTTTNTKTGLSSSSLINVNLTGQPTDTTLTSLAQNLTAIPNVSATVQNGQLTLASTTSGVQISFSQDSSHVLAALGINTFFTGSTAANIGVNSSVANDPTLLAAAKNGNPGDNQTALAIAGFAGNSQTGLNNQSWTDAYGSMVGAIGSTAAQASSDASATLDVRNALQSQQQAVSGVNIDEETVNMLQQQRSYQGAALFLSTVNQMMQSLLNITL
jgi:flagellar hook-associated protein 1 FlgK